MSKIKFNREDLVTKEFLSVDQAAVYANKSLATIRQWIYHDLIDTQKDEFDFRLLLKRSDIDNRLKEVTDRIRRKKPRGKYKTKKEKVNDSTI